MSAKETALAPADLDLGIPLSLEEQNELFDGTMTPRQVIPSTKINHVTGQFEIKVSEDNIVTTDTLSVITIVSKDGRIHWDPKEPAGSGKFVCKSTDGRMPDPHGEFTGPCITCKEARWGGDSGKEKDPKTGKPLKPRCDATLNVLAVNEELPPFLVRASKTSLKDSQAFYTRNFLNPRRAWYAKWVHISLRQEMYGVKPFYVLTFTMGETVPAELQQECYQLFKQSKAVFEQLAAQQSYEDSDVGHPEDGGEGASAAPTESGNPPPPPHEWGVASYAQGGQQPLAPTAPPPPPQQQTLEVTPTPAAPTAPGPPAGVTAAEQTVGSQAEPVAAPAAAKKSTSRSLFKTKTT